MGAFEILSEPSFGPGGSFTPHADQKQFVSAFGKIEGDRSWPDARSLESGIPTQDGRARLHFTPFKTKDGKPHIETVNGLRLQEYIAPREDAIKKQAYDAEMSNRAVAAYQRPSNSPSSDTQVGRSSPGLQVHDETITVPARTA